MKRASKERRTRNRLRRKGSTIVIVMLATSVLLGFCGLAIDYGFLTSDANQLQRTCDAAALAGVQELKKTAVTSSVNQAAADAIDTNSAYTKALFVANQNGVASGHISAINFLNNNTQVQVIASRPRAFLFGRALGLTSSRVTRSALAGVSGVVGGRSPSVAPLGITEETYDAYKNDYTVSHEITLIRQNKDIFERDMDDPVSPDPVVAFDLRDTNAKSPEHMSRQLDGSEVEQANVGDFETTLNASLASQPRKLYDGFESIFTRAAQSPWSDPPTGLSNNGWQTVGTMADQIIAGTASRDNPRVLHLIVTPSTDESHNGTFNTQITGYAPVYVERVYEEEVTHGNGRNRTTETAVRIRVRFLPPTNVSSGEGGFTPGAPNVTPGGVRMIKLIG